MVLVKKLEITTENSTVIMTDTDLTIQDLTRIGSNVGLQSRYEETESTRADFTTEIRKSEAKKLEEKRGEAELSAVGWLPEEKAEARVSNPEFKVGASKPKHYQNHVAVDTVAEIDCPHCGAHHDNLHVSSQFKFKKCPSCWERVYIRPIDPDMSTDDPDFKMYGKFPFLTAEERYDHKRKMELDEADKDNEAPFDDSEVIDSKLEAQIDKYSEFEGQLDTRFTLDELESYIKAHGIRYTRPDSNPKKAAVYSVWKYNYTREED